MALTLPSSNGASFFTSTHKSVVSVNSHFNGGLTQTTSTLTPTRLKNIEESFLEQSLLPPKPFQHEFMAGFVPPNIAVNILKQSNKSLPIVDDKQQQVEYFSSTNSNSEDSYQYSEDYSSETNSSTTVENSVRHTFSNFLCNNTMNTNKVSTRNKKLKSNNSVEINQQAYQANNMATSSQNSRKRKSTGGGRKPNKNEELTPEEQQKRANRREKNKLAAARCRKRRLDQTNKLLNESHLLDKEHQKWVDSVTNNLDKLKNLKNLFTSHNCKMSVVIRGIPNIMSNIDLIAIQNASEKLPDDDDDGDDGNVNNSINETSNSSTTFSFNNNLAEESELEIVTTVPVKVKRPKTLGTTSMFTTAGSNTLTTPSKGFSFADFSTGLTPIIPSLTPNQSLPTPLFNSVMHSTMSSP